MKEFLINRKCMILFGNAYKLLAVVFLNILSKRRGSKL